MDAKTIQNGPAPAGDPRDLLMPPAGRSIQWRGRPKISGRNSRTILKAAVEANEIPAFAAIFPGPFQLSGPQVLEMALAPITPAVPEKENESLPFA
jgi:hypothetical protein